MAAGQALPTAAYFVSPGDLSSVGNAAIQLMQGPGPQGIPASASGSQQHPIVGVSAADYYQQYGSANAATNVPARQRVLVIGYWPSKSLKSALIQKVIIH
jgi:hypothetical protein